MTTRTKVYEDDQQIVWNEVGDGWTGTSIEAKPGSQLANERTIRSRAAQAFASNQTYLALANPTAAQNTAQVRRLTRQVNALLRITLGDFTDDTDT